MDMLARLIGEFEVLIYLSCFCNVYFMVWSIVFCSELVDMWILTWFCLSCHMRVPNSILWWPSGRNDKLISIDEENIFLWSLDCSRKAAQVDVVLGFLAQLCFWYCVYNVSRIVDGNWCLGRYDYVVFW